MTGASRTSSEMQDSPAPSSVNSRPSTPNLSTPPSSTAPDRVQDDSSKLKVFLSIIKKFLGVSDLAAVRFSLPAQLMEPIPNLEYWHYMDRPETFASIGKSDDEVGRMLEALRFWFTKDLKYVKGKPCKPYNSTLGEFFRCNWEINDDAPAIRTPSKSPPQPPPDPLRPTANTNPVRISYITEQTSHHPPVSAFYMDCPARGIYARGFDQISAKFTGTSIRVTPGTHNLGIFITLAKRNNEEYQMTHPVANLGGILRGTLAISVADICFVTCPKTRIKAILHYLDEGWVGKAQNKVQGVVFRYDPDNDKYSRIKDVPEKDVLAKVEGSWQEKVFYTIPSTPAVKESSSKAEPTSQKQLLIDLVPLMPVPKIVPPHEEQLPNESRRFWGDVTAAILEKRWADATRVKQELEQKQRDKAAEREKENVEWKPRFFTGTTAPKGKPDLTEEGKKALQGMQELNFHLKESESTAA